MPKCFKTYDLRGPVPESLNPDLARSIGSAYARVTQARKVAVGYDVRLSSPPLAEALVEGLMEEAVEVLELGLCGTESVYFVTASQDLDGGIMVTASHNPANENGMKMVLRGARPVTPPLLQEIAANLKESSGQRRGQRRHHPWMDDYLNNLTSIVPPETLPSWKVVANAGNGSVGPLLEKLAQTYPSLTLIPILETPDGSFPNGVPNPLLPDKRSATQKAVLDHGADLGVAWDGDYDRCFFFDEKGQFLDTYYLVGLLASFFLEHHPGAPILHDPRLTWATVEAIEAAGGRPVACRTGHVFFKEKLRQWEAPYGAENSGHHYFRDFGYCDSGILPWLVLMRVVHQKGAQVGPMVEKARASFPVSGETNLKVKDSQAALKLVYDRFGPLAKSEDRLDGLSLEFDQWRLNLRASNTEPVLRLNVEGRAQADLVRQKSDEVIQLLEPMREPRQPAPRPG